MSKKEPVQHTDRLGREIELDQCVAFPNSNSLYIGKVRKINNKMIGIDYLGKYRGSCNKYPQDLVVLDSADVSMYMLKAQY